MYLYIDFSRDYLEKKILETKKTMEENEASHKSDVDCLQLQVTQTKTQATNLAESVSNQA